MPKKVDLFSEDAPNEGALPAAEATGAGASITLTALKFADGTLSPEQQRFNKLLARTDILARKIEAARLLADTHRPLHSATLEPLKKERSALMRKMVLWLNDRLQRKGLSAKHKRLTRDILCSLAAGLAMAGDEAMQQIHDAHSDETMAEQEQSAMADIQALMEDILGQPMDDAAGFNSMEEMLQARILKMQAGKHAETEARATHQKPRQKTPRQQLEEQQAQDADGALRTIYRQLVSALHPDRESDNNERTRKTALMKDVNAAYERRDLLALLQLQLRAELADGEKIAALAREKVIALTRLLKDRADVLTRELREVEMHTLSEFGLASHAPVSAGSLKRAMIEQKQHLQADMAMMTRDLVRVQEDAEFKRWLNEQHEAAQDDFDPFERPGFF
jgi:hypothetical protein